MKLPPWIVRFWYAWGHFRVDRITEPAVRKRAVLLNQWILLGTSYSVGVIFLSLSIYIYLFMQGNHQQYNEHVVWYPITASIPVFTGVFLYLLHALRPSLQNFAINAYYFSFVLYNFLMAILLGSESGFQFALLAVILLPYVAYPGEARRYLPLVAITLVFIFLGFYLQYIWPAFFPVPANITGIIFRILIATVIFFDLVSILYIGLHFDVFRKIYNLWQEITGYGEDLFSDPEEIKTNRIVNGGFVVASGLLVVLLLILFAIGVIVVVAGHKGFGLHLLVYCLLTFNFLIFILFIFYLKKRTGRYRSLQLIGDYSIALFISFMSMALGGDLKFYLFLVPMLLTPFFFLRASWQLIVVSELLFVILLAGAVAFALRYPPLLPLPASIANAMSPVIDFFLGLLCVIFSAYTWWKFELTAKIQRIWHAWSRFGLRDGLTPQQAKTEIISNLCMYIDVALMVSAAMMALAFYLLGYAHAATILPPALATLTVLAMFFVMRNWGVARNFLTLGIFFVTLLEVFLLAVFLGEDFVIHYLFFTTLIVPYFIFSRERRRWITLAILLNIGFIMATVWFFGNHDPLYPPGDSATIAEIKKFLRLSINGLIIASMTVVSYFVWHESNLAAERLDEERGQADTLLLNILPQEIADELKATGRSRPRTFASASVLFTDFVGFTKISEKLTPAELVKELDHCFSHFDAVAGRHNLEKIKTIGDSYMAAGGIPRPNHTHLLDCILAALEIKDFMDQMKESRESQGLEYWQLRIGINTGPLVAGIVGSSKFAYDCWGDSVNTASRMESSGAPGRINLSAAAYERARYFFDCESRGLVQAKRKGELEMFFVNRLKPRFSADAKGLRPNGLFLRYYDQISQGATVKYRRETTAAAVAEAS